MVGGVLAKRTAFIFSVRTQNPEHESSRFILNVGKPLPKHTTLQRNTQYENQFASNKIFQRCVDSSRSSGKSPTGLEQGQALFYISSSLSFSLLTQGTRRMAVL